MGKVFVPYPSILRIVALQTNFTNFIITSSTVTDVLALEFALMIVHNKGNIV